MIRAVRVLPTCIGCGVCEDLCPDVFRSGRRARVVGGPEDFAVWEETLRRIAEVCPVMAIEVERARASLPRPAPILRLTRTARRRARGETRSRSLR